jgi:glycosyl-4,4'-diaponeurosporenoate acyltransferase
MRLFWLNFALYWALTLVRILLDPILPQRLFSPERPAFRTQPWENGGEIYRQHLRIDRWKDYLPTFAGPNRFSKRHLASADPRYLNRFILETCRGESNHWRAVGSVVMMKLWTPFLLWLFLLTIALIGNLPFIAVQRYNRPRLQRALALSERRAALEVGGTGLEPGLA